MYRYHSGTVSTIKVALKQSLSLLNKITSDAKFVFLSLATSLMPQVIQRISEDSEVDIEVRGRSSSFFLLYLLIMLLKSFIKDNNEYLAIMACRLSCTIMSKLEEHRFILYSGSQQNLEFGMHWVGAVVRELASNSS